MPEIVQYFLKLSVSLAAVYLFYRVILRPLTFYNWNRWYLLSYSLLCFFIPFVDISPVLARNELTDNTVIRFIPVIDNYSENGKSFFSNFDRWDWLLILFLTGVIVMMIRLVIQYFSYYRLRRSASLVSDQPVKLYQVNKNIVPFSFGNSIFINQQQHTEEELREIIRHEFIHVKQQHTIDILLSEIVCLFSWYNPFAWLIRRAIRQNLEFIADQHVVQNGLNKKEYQYLLLKVVGISSFSIGNQFNFSSLKKRIFMMNKMKTARLHLVKFLFILPLLAVLLLSFRKNIRELILNETRAEKISGISASQKTGSSQAGEIRKSTASGNKSSIEEFELPPSQGKSETSFPAGEIVVITADTIRIVKDTVPNENNKKGQQTQSVLIRPIHTDKDLMIDASLTGPSRLIIRGSNLLEQNPLFVLNGIIQPANFRYNMLAPESIETISVLKNSAATEKYGVQGKDGVIEITTKRKRIVLDADLDIKLREPGLDSAFKGIYIVEGKEFDSKSFDNSDLDPSAIASVSVYKGQSAIEKYGERGRNGVIEINLKDVKIGNVHLYSASPRMGRGTNEPEMKALFEKAQKENVLYLGITNPLNIAINGVDNKDLELQMQDASIQQNNNQFYIIPKGSPGRHDLKVYQKQKNGDLRFLKNISYEFRRLPPPSHF